MVQRHRQLLDKRTSKERGQGAIAGLMKKHGIDEKNLKKMSFRCGTCLCVGKYDVTVLAQVGKRKSPERCQFNSKHRLLYPIGPDKQQDMREPMKVLLQNGVCIDIGRTENNIGLRRHPECKKKGKSDLRLSMWKSVKKENEYEIIDDMFEHWTNGRPTAAYKNQEDSDEEDSPVELSRRKQRRFHLSEDDDDDDDDGDDDDDDGWSTDQIRMATEASMAYARGGT